jgi:hypothetical protein
MLQINLIPPERRRKERVISPLSFALIPALIICLSLLAWDAKMLIDTNNLKNISSEKNKELSNLQNDLKEFSIWQEKSKQLNDWKNAAESVKNSRPFKWWHAIDILLDIFSDFPTVWITSFQTSEGGQTSGRKSPMEAMIKFDCLSLGADTETMTNFRRRLKNTPELTRDIFNGGINEELSFEVTPLNDAKEDFAIKFLIELYRIKKD